MNQRVNTSMGVAIAALDYDAELMLRFKEWDGASFGMLLEEHRSAVIHLPSSRLTITAALAIMMASPPLSAGISSPPLTAVTVTVP